MAVDPHAFVVIGQAHQASGGVTLPAERKPAAGRQKNKRGQK
jgi:hypothetical protein